MLWLRWNCRCNTDLLTQQRIYKYTEKFKSIFSVIHIVSYGHHCLWIMFTINGIWSISMSERVRQKFTIRHGYKNNSWILEKPGNSRKILENIWTSETRFIPDVLFIPDLILNSRILLSPAPTNHPTILLDILCLANLNEIIFFFFLGFC